MICAASGEVVAENPTAPSMTDASATPTHTAGHHSANLKVTTTEKATKQLYFMHDGARKNLYSPLKTNVSSIANKTMGMDGAKEFKFGVTQNHLCELSNYVYVIVSGHWTDHTGSSVCV